MSSTETKTYTHTHTDGDHSLEMAIIRGDVTEVAGRPVWSKYGLTPAAVFQNGTLSVLVRGRRAGAQGQVFVKDGQTVEIS